MVIRFIMLITLQYDNCHTYVGLLSDRKMLAVRREILLNFILIYINILLIQEGIERDVLLLLHPSDKNQSGRLL